MNTQKILDKITTNWPAKAVCFILAVIIYCFHQVSKLEKKDFVVPLEIQTTGNVVPVSGYEKNKYVKVSVRTRSDLIAAFTEKDFTAVADLSGLIEGGTYDIPVEIRTDPRVLLVDPLEITCKPDYVKFNTEKKKIKTLFLKTSAVGIPAYGYKITSLICKPETVTVEGPSSLIDSLSAMYLPSLSVEGAEKNVTKSLEIINSNRFVTLLDNDISVVTATITREDKVKELTQIPVEYDGLDSSFNVSSVQYYVNATVEGSLLDIEKFNPAVARAYVDCSSIQEEGSYNLPVLLGIPKYFTVDSISVKSIEITVVKKEVLPSDNEEKEGES